MATGQAQLPLWIEQGAPYGGYPLPEGYAAPGGWGRSVPNFGPPALNPGPPIPQVPALGAGAGPAGALGSGQVPAGALNAAPTATPLGPAPAPNPANMGVGMNDMARQAAAQAREASNAGRSSVASRGLNRAAGQPSRNIESIIAQAREQAAGSRVAPQGARVGASPPTNLPPAAQGVRGAGGAGAPLGAASAPTAAAGGAGGIRPPAGVRPLTNPNPFPQMSTTGLSPRLSRIANGRLGPSIAFAGLGALGNRMDNQTLQAAGLAGMIGSTAGGGGIGTAAALGAGIAEGTAGSGSSYSRHLQDIYNGEMPEVNNVRDALSLVPAAGMSIPMNVMKQADELGNFVEDVPYLGDGVNFFTDKLGGMAADMGNGEDRSLFNVPGVSQVAEFFGIGAGQPTEEEQQAAAEAQRRAAEMATPEYMLPALQRAGLPKAAAQEAVAEFEASLRQNMVMNELGQFPVRLDGDGNLYQQNPETGMFERQDGDNTVTKSANDLQALDNQQLRQLTAQNFYAGIPTYIAEDQQRRDAMNQAAAMQAMMSQYTDPLLARSEQTAAAYEAAGDPVGAALARDAMTSQAAMMRALPMIQSIDEQQQWDQRIAQIQQQQMLNELFYGGSNEGDQTLDDVTSGAG